MELSQIIDGIGAAVASAKPVQEYCLFFLNWWPMCMTKSEWAAYLQALGVIVTLASTAHFAKKSFVNQAKQTNRMNERAFATDEHAALVNRLNICQFVLFSTQNARDIFYGLSPFFVETSTGAKVLRPPDAIFALGEIDKALHSFEILSVIESGCYQEFAELKLNIKRIEHHLSHLKLNDGNWNYSASFEEVTEWPGIGESVEKCLDTLSSTRDKLRLKNESILDARRSLDNDIHKANYE
ncbi:hypothetical protein [Delftia acidovorans]|uniref:hypothetical protein n=1 Tax=Delftia acidovorans TaxID=80866 RepID=UPI000BC8D947|nr:hypothetical protein [Delftia acidovorans]SOE37595.1 hypothetical protein SAMN05216519_3645 [Delftia acidovorans]